MSADFLDSNILVYLFDDRDPTRQATATELVAMALNERGGAISYQVVQETLNVLTCKLCSPPSPQQVDSFVTEVLQPLWQVMPSQALFLHGLGLQRRYRYGFYDSMIIAAAIQAGCKQLYSEDMQHGQAIEGTTIINPFLDPTGNSSRTTS